MPIRCFRCNQWDGERCACKDGQTIFCGDCREILPLLPKVDLVLTDPPYGINYSSGHGSDSWGDGAIEGDEDTSLRDSVLSALKGIPAIVFGSWRQSRPAGIKMLLIWDTLGALGMGDLSIPWKPSHQEIYVIGRDGFCGKRTSDVISHPPVQSMAKNGRLHPFEKPVALLRDHLLSKHTGRFVVDPFLGSGPTLRACKDLGRRGIGIELEEKYCEIAANRLRQEVLF